MNGHMLRIGETVFIDQICYIYHHGLKPIISLAFDKDKWLTYIADLSKDPMISILDRCQNRDIGQPIYSHAN